MLFIVLKIVKEVFKTTFAKKNNSMKQDELLQLAHEFGSPLYVYDEAKIASQYNRLTNAFSKVEKFKVHYAVKALSNVSILKYLMNSTN